MVKVHGRKPWVLDLMRKRIIGEAMSETGCTKISSLTEDQAKELKAKTNGRAQNKFVAGLFICMADNGHYGELKTWLGNNFALGNDNTRICSRRHSPC